MFYKTTRMTWVANELVLEGFHFFLECMRVPPNWHLWVYVIGKENLKLWLREWHFLFISDAAWKVLYLEPCETQQIQEAVPKQPNCSCLLGSLILGPCGKYVGNRYMKQWQHNHAT